MFTRGLRFTLADMMSELGFDEGFVRRNYLALGLPLPARGCLRPAQPSRLA